MKTEQEQIEEMAKVLCDDCGNNTVFGKLCKSSKGSYICECEKRKATALVQAGYGDVSEYKAEIEQLNKKLAKQTRIARDANAKFTGVEHYLKPFQYKADRLQTKCNDLKKLSDWQREEIKILKAEVNKGCDDCKTVKQAKIDVLKELREKYAMSGSVGSDWATIIYVDNIDELIKEVDV